ncbi:dipeptide/oligopeptide/nickel ABC transporter permease/ATP-binding protein [Salinibacterium sp. SYSU T00001]|uniref:dipeptide/oligopeptide/nickel ABC transporter permease/ATP-binding protein n=1 Tax=Homoserinimonas sedimenticola TaxID=2986805 RepID=UPI002236B854|nr:dipeptide/oligopeptide/nickel ABC transporter permease/ATP-binding protein [Salinibacterium sedimenticola]MCW4385355.1 dipeptide/oligopeptide/nickel ABC transporter permease/ATP-binding protein [Salinibacterium sedimenticola]
MATTKHSRLRSPAGIAATLGAIALLLISVFASFIWGDAAGQTSVTDRLAPSSWDAPFGTDQLGRDVFARVMVATQLSMMLTLGATAISVVGGLILGLIATVLPRHPRRLVTGLIDILLAFPWLLLVLFFSVIWGASAMGAMLAIGFAGVPSLARLVYNLASSVSGRDFVRAARVVGVGPFGILARHVMPNIAGPLLVNTAATASVTLLSFAGLSFLGLGVQAPEYDWGRLLQEGILRIYVNPMSAIGPGLAIVIAGLIFTLASEALAIGSGEGVRATRALAAASVTGRRRAVDRGPAVPLQQTDASSDTIAEVRGLRVAFPDGEGGTVERVHGVDLTIAPGEVVGIVGESGSGKSLTAMALAGLLESPAEVQVTRHHFDGIDMSSTLSREEQSRLGVELAMVFQDPLTSLNPALTVGRQLTEVPEVHLGMNSRDSRERASAALASVHIPEPGRRLRQYPHEFSGGMRQRAMIAMGLTARPRLLIADEPTTALDVTVQRQVISVLKEAQRATGAAIVFISHDIALVSAICDRVVVMNGGEVVEVVSAERIREEATHPYTRALIACLPDMTSDRSVPLPTIGTTNITLPEEVVQ